MSMLSRGSNLSNRRRKQELIVFLVLTLLLAPALATTMVGGYGLAVWVYQMMAGHPDPPAKAARAPGVVPKTKAE
jgi:periplasmic nitrate reductase NapE